MGHELTRRLIASMIDDVVTEARRRLDALRPLAADDIRRAAGPVVAFSSAMATADREIKAVLGRAVYRNEAVTSVMNDAEAMVRRLFRHFTADSMALPPDWRPPPEMIKRQPYLPRWMAGGPGNPMGARAMYIGATVYRIHGTNAPETIGHAVSSGCFRLVNDDVIDLYERVPVGTKIVVQHR